MTLTDQERDQLVKRYLEVDAKRRELDDELSSIKATLRRSYEPGYTETTPDGVKVSVQPNRRFDPNLAERVLADTPDLLKLCTVEKIDSATAKRNLPPAVYDACMAVVGDPRVVIQ